MKRYPRVGLALGCLGIVAVQVLVLVAGDSRVFSGSDAGGRAAAVAAAAENGGCDHDLGYWAAEVDPVGANHPLVNSIRVEDRFVQPATLPFVCMAAPVANWGGPSWATAIPIVGVLLAAIGAWIIERSVGGSGRCSFAVIGGVSPVAFYGTEVWEHAPAVGTAVLGTALILCRSGLWSGALAGLLWGLAILMRVETGIVALGLALGVLLVTEVRTDLLREKTRLLVIGGFASLVFMVERVAQARLIGSDIRSERAATQASGALDELGDRALGAYVSTVGLISTDSNVVALMVGGAFVGVLLVLGAVIEGARLEPRLVRGFALVAGVVVLLRVSDPAFVPGAFVAAPVATVGIYAMRSSAVPHNLRVLSIGALVALPVTWAVQWRGSQAPQWGGRYVLLSTTLLAICGLSLVRLRGRTLAGHVVLAATVAIGSMGLYWHVERTRAMGAAVEELLEVACEDVFVSTAEYLLREGGAFDEIRAGVRTDDCRLLSTGLVGLDDALETASRSGAMRASVLFAGAVDDPSSVLDISRIRSRDVVSLNGLAFTVFVVELG